MMLENSEIERKIKKLKDDLNNNKKSSLRRYLIKDNRIWTQKTKAYISNIVFDINRDVKYIEKARLLLNELNNINLGTKKHYELKNKKDEQKPIKVYRGLTSEKSARILKSAYNKINKMKVKSKELQKYNGQSLKHASSQYYRTSRPKSAIVPEQKIYKQTRPVSASTCYESKIAERNNHRNYKSKTIINSNNRTFRDGYKVKKEKIKLNKNSDEQKLMDLRYINLDKMYKENNKRAVNLGRLNDIYRLQLNKNLGLFSPSRHLKDMKHIQIEDMNVRREMQDIKKELDELIDERKRGLFFKREYEKYIKKNNSALKSSNTTKNIHNRNINSPISNFKLRTNYSSKNLYNPKIRKTFKENLNEEQLKKISVKEKIEKKRENLKDLLNKLGETLEVEPIHKFINDKNVTKRKSIRNDLIEIQKQYFPILDEVNKDMKEIICGETDKMTYDEIEENIIRLEEILSKELAHNSPTHNYE